MEDVFNKRWSEIKSDAGVLKSLYQMYKAQTGTPPCCDDVVKQYFLAEKRKRVNMKNTQMLTRNYKLKPGSVLHIASLGIHVTNDNLTDFYAEILLEDARNKKHFELINPPVIKKPEQKPPQENTETKEVVEQDLSIAGSQKTNQGKGKRGGKQTKK